MHVSDSEVLSEILGFVRDVVRVVPAGGPAARYYNGSLLYYGRRAPFVSSSVRSPGARGSFRRRAPAQVCGLLSRGRAIFRETITAGAERCAQGGRVVLERLNARQLGYRFSYAGSREYVASAILNRRR